MSSSSSRGLAWQLSSLASLATAGSSSSSSHSAPARTYIVSQAGEKGTFSSLSAAVRAAQEDGRGRPCDILVREGVYVVNDAEVIDASSRDVVISGDIGLVSIRSAKRSALVFRGDKAHVTLKNLTIHGVHFSGRDSSWTLDRCDVSNGVHSSQGEECARSRLALTRTRARDENGAAVHLSAPGASLRVYCCELLESKYGVCAGLHSECSVEVISSHVHDCETGLFLQKPCAARVSGCTVWRAPVKVQDKSGADQPSPPLDDTFLAEPGAGPPDGLQPLAVGPAAAAPAPAGPEAGREHIRLASAMVAAQRRAKEAEVALKQTMRQRAQSEHSPSGASSPQRAELERLEKALAASDERVAAAEARAAAAEARAAAAEARAEELEREVGRRLPADEEAMGRLTVKELEALQPRLLGALSAAIHTRARAFFDCPVCKETVPRAERRALHPCRHVLCGGCGARICGEQPPRCPIARCAVGELVPIYD